MAAEKTLRADGRGSTSSQDLIVLEEATVARPYLGQGRPLDPCEPLLRRRDVRGNRAQERIRFQLSNGVFDRGGVDRAKDLFVVVVVDDTVREMLLEVIRVFGLQRGFHTATAGRESDN